MSIEDFITGQNFGDWPRDKYNDFGGNNDHPRFDNFQQHRPQPLPPVQLEPVNPVRNDCEIIVVARTLT